MDLSHINLEFVCYSASITEMDTLIFREFYLSSTTFSVFLFIFKTSFRNVTNKMTFLF